MQGVPQQFPFEKDSAQFRHLPQVPGVELYHAHIERYVFEPHTHNAFAIGTVDFGAERFRYRGAQHLAAPGSLVLMNPDELHTGEAETAGGWNCCRVSRGSGLPKRYARIHWRRSDYLPPWPRCGKPKIP